MPQLEQLDTYASQIFWLALTFIPLFVILWKVALPRVDEVLDARQRRIETDLERARQSKEEAEEVSAAYDRALAEARSRAHGVLTEASKRLAEVAAAEQAALRRRLAEEEQAAVAGIARARQAAMRNVRQVAIEVAGLAVT
ncbi:MAG: F0F1 ATP synthase subunit B', partial [Kiloniellales bacterium]